MKFTLIVLIALCSLSVLRAQDAPDLKGLKLAYKSEFEKALSDPKAKKLYDKADSYGRWLHTRIMKKLGLDPALDLFAEEVTGNGQEPQQFDSAFIFNVTKNTGWQNETTVSINRRDKNLIIAGANDASMMTKGMPVYITTDGGKSWKANRVPIPDKSFTPNGDPVITCDRSGMFYYTYLSGVEDGFGFPDLQVATSMDGVNWKVSPPVAGGAGTFFEDKEWIAVDDNPGSKYFGRVYIVWMRYDFSDVSPEENTLHLVWSDDTCNTWSEPVNLNTKGRFSMIKIGKNGEVFITYGVSEEIGEQSGDFVINVSLDGGQSFLTHHIGSFTNYPYSATIGRPAIKGEEGFRAYASTTFDVDARDNSLHLVYAQWNENTSGDPAASLYYTRSFDLGETWDNPRILGIADPKANSTAHDRFFPSLAIDKTTHMPHLLYYSSESDENNLLTAAHHLVIDDKLLNYSECISCVTFNPLNVKSNGSPFMGDYIGLDAYDSVVAAVWTQPRGTLKDGDIFVGVKKMDSTSKSGVTTPVVINSPEVWLSAPYPNPVVGETVSVSYYIPKQTPVSLSLVNTQGIKVKTLLTESESEGTHTRTLSLTDVRPGAYILTLSSSAGEAVQQIIVQ